MGLVYGAQGRPLREDDPLGTLHPYGASKAGADLLLQAGAVEFGRRLTIVRPFSFTGPHDVRTRLFPSLLRAAAERQPCRLSRGEQIRDFCSVSDIAALIVRLLDGERAKKIEIFNVGSGRELKLRHLVEQTCDDLGLKVELHFGALPYHPHEPMHLVANIDKVRDLGWEPQQSLSHAVAALAREMCLPASTLDEKPIAPQRGARGRAEPMKAKT